MRADFTTSNKDSLRGEAKKRGGEDSSLPNQSLLISLPSLSIRRPPRWLQTGNFVRFRIWSKADII